MDNWRKQKGEFHHHRNHYQEVEGTQARSSNRKPHPASWQRTVPSWEKKFCTSVGSVSWRKLLETKRIMYLYENVVQWNDSAVKEAFNNAKTRFWAEMNGIPCDISLPDPDIYIDKIDWNSYIDPDLLLDLEREPKATEEVEKDKNVVTLSSSLLLNQSLSCTGWGDAEQDLKKDTELYVAPDNEDSTQNANAINDENPWEPRCNEARDDGGWGSCWNNTRDEWNQHDNEWDNRHNESRNVNFRSGGDWGMHNHEYGRNRESTGLYMSRYKTSRFRCEDNYHVNRGWRSKRGYNRSSFACRSPFPDEKHSSRRWNSMNSCGPNTHHGFGRAGISWDWEKQVL